MPVGKTADKKLLVCNLTKEKIQDKKDQTSIQRMSQRLGRFTEEVLDQ